MRASNSQGLPTNVKRDDIVFTPGEKPLSDAQDAMVYAKGFNAPRFFELFLVPSGDSYTWVAPHGRGLPLDLVHRICVRLHAKNFNRIFPVFLTYYGRIAAYDIPPQPTRTIVRKAHVAHP